MEESSTNYYVQPEELRTAIIEYQLKRKEAAEQGKPEPEMSNYLGSAIISIANKFAYSPKFINYTYRDEMVSDGIVACVKGVKAIDLTNPGNPFTYLTKCCYYAFILKIKSEKKEMYTKSEIIKEHGTMSFDLQDTDVDEDFKNSYLEFLQSNMNVSGDFLKKKIKPKVVGPLEEFLGDE